MPHKQINRSSTVWMIAAFWLLLSVSSTALAQTTTDSPIAVPPSQPEPIKTTRKFEKLTIPDVPRDQVICFALYTVENQVLKLSAQFYPLQAGESRDAHLEINHDGVWQRVATTEIPEPGWSASFRVDHWDHSQDWQYRVVHAGGAKYSGRIRRDPRDKETIVVAAFTGNSNKDRRPRADMVRNIQHQDPDLLFFSGDQSYDHSSHTAAWLLFGRQFGEIIKDRPTVTIPDDHDVGQPNLWGEAGNISKVKGADDGGYLKSADYVNMVQRAQTSHLPDPYDPTPVKQDISVYYTSLNVGGIDFAILEDRKWKTGPAGFVPQQGPRPDHINDPNYDPQTLDLPEAKLLGQRQLDFLHDWSNDWQGTDMKAVLSQTIFAGGAHIHGGHQGRLHADLDSNGWPQAGRARALRALRRCFAFHIAGDQHLATVIQHGTNQWEDAGYSFCVPSIVNFYGRWWWPLEKPAGRLENNPLPFAGRYYDGFRNKVTMHAYANPTQANYQAAGHGIVRFNKPTRKITMECWPRHVDVASGQAEQFPGWPITIGQEENYGRQAMAYLPTIKIVGPKNAVVTVIDEASGKTVYTLRIRGNSWRPKVFRLATYTLEINGGDKTQTFTGIESLPATDTTVLEVRL